ncbi:MAG: acyclic terpene utilization AtuA family protein [Pseudomonadota bacterium]
MTRVLVPSGALGLNYDKVALQRGLDMNPDIIAVDGGSTDSGPAYLGQGVSKYSRASTKLEWAGLMEARAQAGVPLVIGTAGTCGTDDTVDWMFDITKEIAAELGQKVKVALLYSSQDPKVIAAQMDQIIPLPGAKEVSVGDIETCENIVALAGAEQVQAAINTGADIIIAGRTTDTAIIAALPLQNGDHAGAAWHGAKIGECGALCATNPQSGVIIVEFDKTGFTIVPLADGAHASPHTVSAHMLYENSDPFILTEPGGVLDVTDASYQALDETRVRVEGSEWKVADVYTVKLEGARQEGFQTAMLSLIRNPDYVAHAQKWAADIHEKCSAKVMDRLGLGADAFSITLHVIGQNATLGALETKTGTAPEAGVLGVVTAQSEDIVAEISKMLDPYMLHHPLTKEEEQPTFAFPFSPAAIPRGKIFGFCLHHVLPLADPMDAFRLEVHELG